MKYAYLLINFLTIIFPVLLSFDSRVRFYKQWKFIWPGMAITGLVFLFWDVLFTLKGVWSFNPDFITGITFFKLPLEEILFFLTVPFACLFVYACLNYYVEQELPQPVSRIISNVLLAGSAVIIVLYHNKIYTLITFALLFILIAALQYVFKQQWINRFYVAYAVSLVPFYIVNGVLTAIPIVLYNNAQNMHIRIGTIPVEDHFYSMALLIMNVGFFEYFRRKNTVNQTSSHDELD